MSAAPRSIPTEPERPPEYRYHLLRAALAAQQPGLAGLDPRARTLAGRQADKTFELESLVLGSPEAADVVIPPGRLDEAMAELRGRYLDPEAFRADLEENGLDEYTLRGALHRELIFDACMQRVAATRPKISDLDERLFYDLHRERFTEPERRTASHILVTINEDFAENRREAAWARIEQIAARLQGRTNRFPSLARKHSECPTAMEDGRLGTVPRGQLYAALDAVLFALPEGAVSPPVESEMGFHLLWCERIQRGRAVPFSKARPRIRQILEERAARNCQKAWIGALRGTRAPGGRP